MNTQTIRTVLGLSLAGVLAASAGLVHAQSGQTVQARVLSATPVRDGAGTSYNVTYEYNGRRYTTRTDYQPGATIPVEANAYGVTTAPVTPQNQLTPYPVETDNRGYAQQPPPQQQGQQYATGSPWDDVVPEPGVVVSGTQPAPVYGQPAYPAAVYPAPVYVQPAYAYPQPYVYPPVGISLNLGYSRGWGGGYRGYGGYRGGYGGWRGGGYHGWHR